MGTPSVTPTITILGAGIGGLALAIGLLMRGVSVKIYEAADSFSAVGAGVGFGPNALNAINLIDSRFRKEYENAATRNEKPEFKHSMFDALYAEPGFGEKKGWVRGLIYPPDVVVFGKRAASIRQVDHKVVVAFEDGDELVTDALIGCDGVKGITRDAVLGDLSPEEIPPKYCGTYIYRGIIPMEDAKEILGKHAGDAKWFMTKGRGLVAYPISKGKEVNLVFFVEDKKPWVRGDTAVSCTREEMEADLSDFDERLLKLLDWVPLLRWPIWHHPETSTYYTGRVCLLGDAAHASSPHQAAGAEQALEDAAVLTHLLAMVKEPEQLELAFQVYDSLRRPRAQKVVTTSQTAGMIKLWRHPEIGCDMEKIVDDANCSVHWIWQHDILADLQKAELEFHRMLALGRE
ncbi:mannitol 1-phosphate dehydrogenase [Bimuria novae-zelandiae CBS 107.79]|uniref:Mannitol 1-phosphate dehydrogenase n=1 Tax=Bimuria novae-zelandiae CBS 107.79 TaxID=1447943 RepID=A0A6A5VHQ8_9PLEO|nr:mannitol 1-phosphate dehydrogenase [Bimuria novae-zelandiae CBS 107.79]